jgi:hypothetical protein
MGTVLINGVAVDEDDPCAIARELRKAELTLACGGGIVRARFGDTDEVQWSAANGARLRELIDRYERQCGTGSPSGSRKRFAREMRFTR